MAMATGWNPQTYDATRRRMVPCFDAFYGTAAELVARTFADASRQAQFNVMSPCIEGKDDAVAPGSASVPLAGLGRRCAPARFSNGSASPSTRRGKRDAPRHL